MTTRQGAMLSLILAVALLGTSALHAAPPGTAPAGGSAAPASGTGTTPDTGAPASGEVAGTAASAEKRLLVKVPAGGSYLAWLEGRGGSGPAMVAPVAFTGAEVSLVAPKAPEGLTRWALVVLDQKTGYSAAKELPATLPESATLAATDFNRVHRVRVQVTGAGGKPVASGTATLTDAGGDAATRVWDPTVAGVVEFTAVRSGTARLEVQPTGAGSTTKEVEIRLSPGETAQTLAVALPEVTAVVEGSAPPAGTTGAGESAPAAGGTQSPSQPGTPMPPPATGSPITTLVGFLLLAGAIYAVYVVGRNRGWTVDRALARLGVQPGPEPATAVGPASLRPATAPAPPVDPNVCAFCGERKDPLTGRCACSLDTPQRGEGGVAAAPFGAAAPAVGTGPRLVAVQGVYMGQVFPLGEEVTIGRDPASEVPLAEDSTVSRRHARIHVADGGYRVEDLGSSNGTFLNGGRVTEAALRPGDEVSIGGTRFRFEM
jgi:hypothetical protein